MHVRLSAPIISKCPFPDPPFSSSDLTDPFSVLLKATHHSHRRLPATLYSSQKVFTVIISFGSHKNIVH